MIIIKQRQLYTYKFNTSRLKEFNYDIVISFSEARISNEIVALADNQLLRSIRDIRNRDIDFEHIDELYAERDRLKSSKFKNDISHREQINAIQQAIDRSLFIPEYVTIFVEDKKHYEHIYQNGLKINGHVYNRFSCSAGQGRSSTVVLVDDEIAEELRRRINNGRKMDIPLVPSKLKGYFGLCTSATQIVSEPRFIVVRDFANTDTFVANYVTETGPDEDDIVDVREVTQEMNRTDGMGLISPTQSQRWAEDLGLDYLPAQWIVRQSFLKGMLCTFDFHQFCEEVSGGNYIVETIYKDAVGNPVMADLRDYDVIISESMFKLWDSYDSCQFYIDNYHANKLYWGVARATPKEDSNTLGLNYQYIQTLNLSKSDIEELCSQFVDWLQGVSYANPWYMMLFVLGVKNTPERISDFIRSGDNYWLKSLVVNPELKNDKFVRTKIRELIKRRIHDACLGTIFVDGNYQMLISDPYAFMQHVCGLPVTGLLKQGEFYSSYWNKRSVRLVDAMRSPLTYRSEHVLLNLRDDCEVEKWYQYCTTGIILNYYGHEVYNFAGADFDGDILATTNNQVMIRGIYKDEIPVISDPKKSEKKIVEDYDLYNADIFSFGSIIGEITNKSSNGYAMLPLLEEKYGDDSKEVNTTISRLKQCCKAQACQIDKAKIGREVKGIPKLWIEKNVSDDDNDFYSSILLRTKPYFFKYRYKETKKKYDKYVEENKASCLQRFGVNLFDLLAMHNLTPDQNVFIKNYYHYMPVVMSDSTMNMLCKHIESVDFAISSKIKSIECAFDYSIYKNENVTYTEEEYASVVKCVKTALKRYSYNIILEEDYDDSYDEKYSTLSIGETLEIEFSKYIANVDVITNILVDYFYMERPSSDKSLLWDVCGRYMFRNVKRKNKSVIHFPVRDNEGDIEYMGNRYSLNEVDLHE